MEEWLEGFGPTERKPDVVTGENEPELLIGYEQDDEEEDEDLLAPMHEYLDAVIDTVSKWSVDAGVEKAKEWGSESAKRSRKKAQEDLFPQITKQVDFTKEELNAASKDISKKLKNADLSTPEGIDNATQLLTKIPTSVGIFALLYDDIGYRPGEDVTPEQKARIKNELGLDWPTKNEIAGMHPYDAEKWKSIQGDAGDKAWHSGTLLARGLNEVALDTAAGLQKAWRLASKDDEYMAGAIKGMATVVDAMAVVSPLGGAPLAAKAYTDFGRMALEDPLGAYAGIMLGGGLLSKGAAVAKGLPRGPKGVLGELAEVRTKERQRLLEPKFAEKLSRDAEFLAKSDPRTKRGRILKKVGSAVIHSQAEGILGLIPKVGNRFAGEITNQKKETLIGLEREQRANEQAFTDLIVEMREKHPELLSVLSEVINENAHLAPSIHALLKDYTEAQTALDVEVKAAKKEINKAKKNKDPDEIAAAELKLKTFEETWKAFERALEDVETYGDKMPAEVVGSKDQRFAELADLQRGTPELKMLSAQTVMGGSGILSYLLEHVGDLTHRMSKEYAEVTSYGDVLPKVRRALRELRSPYKYKPEMGTQEAYSKSGAGFFKDHMEQLARTYRFNKKEQGEKRTFEQYVDDVSRSASEYAKAHSKLPVYNEMQRAARDAAVHLGLQMWPEAIRNLEILKAELDKGASHWAKISMKDKPPKPRPTPVAALDAARESLLNVGLLKEADVATRSKKVHGGKDMWKNAARTIAENDSGLVEFSYRGVPLSSVEMVINAMKDPEMGPEGLRLGEVEAKVKIDPVAEPKLHALVESNLSYMLSLRKMLDEIGRDYTRYTGNPEFGQMLARTDFMTNFLAGYFPEGMPGKYFEKKKSGKGLSAAEGMVFDHLRMKKGRGKQRTIDDVKEIIGKDSKVAAALASYVMSSYATLQRAKYIKAAKEALKKNDLLIDKKDPRYKEALAPVEGQAQRVAAALDVTARDRFIVLEDVGPKRMKKYGDLSGFAVPLEVKKNLDKYTEYFSGVEYLAGAMQQVFKLTHTIMQPGYFFNTGAGVAAINMLDGGTPIGLVKAGAEIARKGPQYVRARENGRLLHSSQYIGTDVVGNGIIETMALGASSAAHRKFGWNDYFKNLTRIWRAAKDPLTGRKTKEAIKMGAVAGAGLYFGGASILTNPAGLALLGGSYLAFSQGKRLAIWMDQTSRLATADRYIATKARALANKTGAKTKEVKKKLWEDNKEVNEAFNYADKINIDYQYLPLSVEYHSAVASHTPFIKFANRAFEMMLDLPTHNPGAFSALTAKQQAYIKDLDDEDKFFLKHQPFKTQGQIGKTKDGSGRFINFAWSNILNPSAQREWNPYHGILSGKKASPMSGYEALRQYGDASKTTGGVIPQITNRFFNEGYMGWLRPMMTGEDKFGRQLTDGERTKEVLQVFSPTSTYYMRVMGDAIIDGKDRNGRTPEQILAASRGFKEIFKTEAIKHRKSMVKARRSFLARLKAKRKQALQAPRVTSAKRRAINRAYAKDKQRFDKYYRQLMGKGATAWGER